MAYEHKNDEKGVWRTVGGRRIFIADGDDLATAMQKSGKFSKTNNNNQKLAKELVEFAKYYDIYEFRNNYDDEKDAINDNLKDLEKGDTKDTINWLKDIAENDEDKKIVEKANGLLKKLGVDNEKVNTLKYEDMTETDKMFVEDAVKDTIREWKKAGDLSLDDIRVNDVIKTLNTDMKGFIGKNNEDAIKQHIAILMKKYRIG